MTRKRFIQPFAALLVFCWTGAARAEGNWPSLFRGVVASDGEAGVRIVSVDPESQAWLADLRPEDVIVRIGEADVKTIEDFSTISAALKGTTDHAEVVVFRNGAPRRINLHLYSYPVLKVWGVEFIPNFEMRFGDPSAGRDYWTRLARGFTEVGNKEEALDATLNALHNLPGDPQTALAACEGYFQLAQDRLAEQAIMPALTYLGAALSMAEKLFAYPLSEQELQRIKSQLNATLSSLRSLRSGALNRHG